MLFASIYSFRPSTTESASKRLNVLFGKWQPPKGYDIKVHYAFALSVARRPPGG